MSKAALQYQSYAIARLGFSSRFKIAYVHTINSLSSHLTATNTLETWTEPNPSGSLTAKLKVAEMEVSTICLQVSTSKEN